MVITLCPYVSILSILNFLSPDDENVYFFKWILISHLMMSSLENKKKMTRLYLTLMQNSLCMPHFFRLISHPFCVSWVRFNTFVWFNTFYNLYLRFFLIILHPMDFMKQLSLLILYFYSQGMRKFSRILKDIQVIWGLN